MGTLSYDSGNGDLRRLIELQALAEVSRAYRDITDRKRLFAELTARTARLLDAEQCAIVLRDEQTGDCVCQWPAFGLTEEEVAAGRFPAAQVEAMFRHIPPEGALVLNDPAQLRDLTPHFVQAWQERSMLLARLEEDGRLLGCIRVANKRSPEPDAAGAERAPERGFTARDAGLLGVIASQVALAIEKHQVYQALQASLQRRTAEAEALNAIAEVAVTAPDLATVLNTALDRLLPVLEVEAGAVYLPAARNPHILLLSAQRGLPEAFARALAHLPAEVGFTGRVYRTGETVALQDVASHAPDATPAIVAEYGWRTFAAVPLRCHGQVLGVLNVSSRQRRELRAEELDFLRAAGDQLGSAVQNARLRDEAQQRLTEVEGLAGLAEALTEAVDTDAVLRAGLQRIVELAGVDGAECHLADDRGVLSLAATRGLTQAFATASALFEFPAGEGIPGLAYARRRPVYVADARSDPRYVRRHLARVAGYRSLLCVPLLGRRSLLGTFMLYSVGQREYSPGEQALLMTAGGQVAVALERARLYEQVQRQRVEEQEILLRLSQTLVGSTDPQVVLNSTAETVRAALQADYVSLMIPDDSDRHLVLVAGAGWEPEMYERYRLDIETSREGHVFRTGEVVQQPDVQSGEPFPCPLELRERDVVSSATVPLRSDGGILGTLCVHMTQARQFGSSDMRLLSLIAGQAAIALERARAHQAANEAEVRYRGLFEGVPIGLYRSTPDGQLLDVNRALAEMLGYPDREALLAVNAGDLYATAEDRQRREAAAEQQGDLVSYEARLRRRDGTIIRTQISARTVRGADGTVLYYEGSLEDVTERRRAEEEIRRRAAHLEALNTVVTAAAAATDLPALLETALDQSLRALGLEIGALWVRDVHVVRGLSPGLHASMGQMARAAGLDIPGPVVTESWEVAIGGPSSGLGAGEESLARLLTSFGVGASIAVPILTEGRRIGGLVVAAPEPRDWSPEEVALVEAVGRQLGAAAERLHLFHEVQARAERMARLAHVGEMLSRPFRLAEVLAAIGEGALALCGADRAAVYVLNPDGTVTCPWSRGLSPAYLEQVTTRIREMPGARLLEVQEAVLIPDALELPESSPLRGLALAEGYRALGLWPLVYGEQGTVAIGCYHDEPHAWSPADQEVIQAFTRQAAVAVQNARLFEAEQERRAELAAVYALSRQLVATDTLETVLDTVAGQAVAVAHVTFCRVLLLENGLLVCRAAHPTRVVERDMGVGRSDAQPAWPHYRRALAQARPRVLLQDDPELGPAAQQALFLDVARSLCLVPLRVGDEAIGLLVFGEARSVTRESFDAGKLSLIAAIADQAASALHRAGLHSELEESYVQTVLALANAMDARDTYTAGHSQRMAEWAVATARELGCPEPEVDRIRWGALLHDIGKIGVPDGILLKPGELSGHEWSCIRRHPEMGAQIVAPVKKLAAVAPIIRGHQEHWDGSGYPDELAGERIPLGARVLAVVDAYSAITDERPYKPARSHAEAVQELHRCAGTQFDPLVVEAFLRVLQTGGRPRR